MKQEWSVGVGAAASVLAVWLVVTSAASSAQERVGSRDRNSTSHTTASTAPSPGPSQAPRLRVGVALAHPAALGALESAGITPDLVDEYVSWSSGAPFDAARAKRLLAEGIATMITWQPWVSHLGVNQPDYALSTIVAGRHDAYVRAWADELAAYDRPVTLRFAHEMNGNWYPWGAGVNGNTPAEYVAAWQHIHDIFTEEGANKVIWQWAPNQRYTSDAGPLRQWYPGDAYVDEVGLSAYNWGDTQHLTYSTHWQTFSELFAASSAEVRTFTQKPQAVAETGTTDRGGDKAAWLQQMFAQALAMPQIVSVTYFDLDDEKNSADWRLEGRAQLAAFRQGLLSTRAGQAATTATTPARAVDSARRLSGG